jgi:superfamily I DNA/RNA helicase
LAGRDLPISRDRVGTLHSHCWHALGGPELAEANVDDWNRDNPELAITPVRKQGRLDGEEAAGEDSEMEKGGDELLQRLSRYRGLILPRQSWPETLIGFDKKWGQYKRENGLLDFTDLIETCLHDVAVAPHAPSVIFADEAQDLNRMQLSLVRKWGERANYFIVAGDDDQTIYSFTGATPEAFLDPDIPDDHKIVLKQSYRVPRAVHRLAEEMIRRVTRRQPKEYLPRPEDGALDRFSRDGYKRTEIAIVPDAMKQVEQGKTVMFLASCSYMLRPLIQVLRKQGVPFHNPYRKSNGFWNPLRTAKPGSTANRIVSLLVGHPDFGEGHRQWSMGDVALWAEWLQAKGVLRHGVKADLRSYDIAQPATIERLNDIFEPDALDSLMGAWDHGYRELLEWWRSRVTADVGARVQFPAEIAAKRGALSLLEVPQVMVGTIHSVKGGQADVVYLFPDLSPAGAAQYARSGAARDSVIRQFYVGVTRTREKLYLCQHETGMAVAI